MSESEDWVRLGKTLREAREYLGFTQDEVAKYLGVHRPSVSMIESGERKVDSFELAKLSKLYRRSINSLLGVEGPEPLSTQMLNECVGLPAEDIEELRKFAQYLRFKKGT